MILSCSNRKVNLIVCLASLITLISCKNEEELTGFYAVREKTLQDQLLMRRSQSEGRIVGSELTIKKDSSFVYVTCGNIMSGNWRRQDSKLIFAVKNNRYRLDSLQKLRGSRLEPAEIQFKILKNQLYREWKTENGRTIELLTKTDYL